jgi:NSS family neurotransmitter:Na+ symporter
MYFILAFCLAYPAFMAEILIGRHGQANAITSLRKISRNNHQRFFAFLVGFIGIVGATLILSFYSIVAGWMLAYTAEPVVTLLNYPETASWLTSFSLSRNVIFTAIFMVLTVSIISRGVEAGIERWSKRLMPLMIMLLIALIAYVLTLDGASEGLKVYLQPDFSRIFEPDLVLSALGQAFFSLSLGSGVILIYGSYISKQENAVVLGAQVTLIDVSIAFLAGLLIIPAMYVAHGQGVEIFATDGSLLSEDTLVFTVLPNLFLSMGNTGIIIALGFFALMSVAALTSSISMLEAPVSYAVENHHLKRKTASIVIGVGIFIISVIILMNFSTLFMLIITISTQYSQPIVATLYCVFVGWIWHRHQLLIEIKQGNENIEETWFWKIWPWYIKFICPLAIAMVFVHSFK